MVDHHRHLTEESQRRVDGEPRAHRGGAPFQHDARARSAAPAGCQRISTPSSTHEASKRAGWVAVERSTMVVRPSLTSSPVLPFASRAMKRNQQLALGGPVAFHGNDPAFGAPLTIRS